MGTNRGSVSRREHKEVAHLGTPWWGAATIAELRLPLPCLTTVTVEARGTHDCTVMAPVLSQTSLCTFLSVKELGKIIQFPLFTVAARMLGEEISSPIQILWGMTFSSRKTKAVVEFPPKDAGQPKQSQMVTTYTRLAAQYPQTVILQLFLNTCYVTGSVLEAWDSEQNVRIPAEVKLWGDGQ